MAPGLHILGNSFLGKVSVPCSLQVLSENQGHQEDIGIKANTTFKNLKETGRAPVFAGAASQEPQHSLRSVSLQRKLAAQGDSLLTY